MAKQKQIECAQRNLDSTTAPVEKTPEFINAGMLFPEVAHRQYFKLLIPAVTDGLIANLSANTDTVKQVKHRPCILKGY